MRIEAMLEVKTGSVNFKMAASKVRWKSKTKNRLDLGFLKYLTTLPDPWPTLIITSAEYTYEDKHFEFILFAVVLLLAHRFFDSKWNTRRSVCVITHWNRSVISDIWRENGDILVFQKMMSKEWRHRTIQLSVCWTDTMSTANWRQIANLYRCWHIELHSAHHRCAIGQHNRRLGPWALQGEWCTTEAWQQTAIHHPFVR